MTNGQFPTGNGLNFCPRCGCNIHAVAMALRLIAAKPPSKATPADSAVNFCPRCGCDVQAMDKVLALATQQPAAQAPAPIKSKVGQVQRKPLSAEQSAELVRRRQEGQTHRQISREMGIKLMTVQSHLFRKKHSATTAAQPEPATTETTSTNTNP